LIKEFIPASAFENQDEAEKFVVAINDMQSEFAGKINP